MFDMRGTEPSDKFTSKPIVLFLDLPKLTVRS